MSKKVIVAIALVMALLVGAGFGVWGSGLVGKAQADDQSQTQTSKPWMGVSLADITPKLVQQLGLTQDKGVVIVKVVSGSPAEQAGLQEKDILLKIGDTDIDTAKKAVSTVSSYKVGDAVTLTIIRGTDQKTLNVTLAAAPSTSGTPKSIMPLQVSPELGLYGVNLTDLLKELNLEGIQQGQLFDHYLGAQIQLTDKDGNPVTVQTIPGKVASVSDNTLVVNKNGGGTANLTVPSDAIIREGTGMVALSALAAGDKVVVITIKDQVKAVLAGQEVTIWPGIRGNGIGRGLMPQLFGQQLRSGIGNMLDNMMKNWQGNLERFQNKLQESKSLKTGVMWE